MIKTILCFCGFFALFILLSFGLGLLAFWLGGDDTDD